MRCSVTLSLPPPPLSTDRTEYTFIKEIFLKTHQVNVLIIWYYWGSLSDWVSPSSSPEFTIDCSRFTPELTHHWEYLITWPFKLAHSTFKREEKMPIIFWTGEVKTLHCWGKSEERTWVLCGLESAGQVSSVMAMMCSVVYETEAPLHTTTQTQARHNIRQHQPLTLDQAQPLSISEIKQQQIWVSGGESWACCLSRITGSDQNTVYILDVTFVLDWR